MLIDCGFFIEGDRADVTLRLFIEANRKSHFVTNVNSRCTVGVANAAKRAWNWGEAPRWTVVAHGARAIPGEVVRALRCWLRGATLAEITLQTRT